MAKKVWVFTLDNKNISPDLEDINGVTVSHPMKHHIYVADDNHPQIANDGSKALYHSDDGILDPIRLGEVLKHGANPPKPKPVLPAPTNVKVTSIDGSAKTAIVSWDTVTGADEYWLSMTGYPAWKAGVNPYTLNNLPLDKELTITVQAKDTTGAHQDSPQSAGVKFTVPAPPPALTGIKITGADTGAVGTPITLSTAPVPTGAQLGTVAWTSSDSAVATVDNKGVVTPVKAGSVTITATSGSVHADHAITIS